MFALEMWQSREEQPVQLSDLCNFTALKIASSNTIAYGTITLYQILKVNRG